MNTPNRPLEEEGAEPLQERLDYLPGGEDGRSARGTMLLIAAGAVVVVALLAFVLMRGLPS